MASVSTWSKRLFAILLGVTLALLALELLLRVAYPIFPYTIQAALRDVRVTPFTDKRILPQQIWQSDSAYQLVSRANAIDEMQFPDARVGFRVTTKNMLDPNSHVGFRVPSFDWEPRWPVDAVVVGDSFSFCYTEYEQCWARRLDTQYGMSVVNLGQVATGSISRINLLATFGLPYEPDLVIWQWYGNDFNDDYGMYQMQNGIPSLEETFSAPPLRLVNGPLAHWLETNSAVYWIVQTAVSSKEELYKYERFVDPYRVNENGVDFTFGRPYILKAFDLSSENNQFGQTITQEKISEARLLVDGIGASMVIVMVPSKEEVYARWTETYLGQETIRSLSEGRRRMNVFCGEQQLLCLDLTPDLRSSAENGEHVFWPGDTHLNDYGNQVVADSIWQFLQDHDLVEGVVR